MEEDWAVDLAVSKLRLAAARWGGEGWRERERERERERDPDGKRVRRLNKRHVKEIEKKKN